MKAHRNSSFTLIEIMVVVVIVGVLTAFAIPSYTKMMRRSHYKQARDNLLLIYNAAQLFITRTGVAGFPDTPGTLACPLPGFGGCSLEDVAMINDILDIALVPDEIWYRCQYSNISGERFCWAFWPRNATSLNYFWITIYTDLPLSSTNPTCTGNFCS